MFIYDAQKRTFEIAIVGHTLTAYFSSPKIKNLGKEYSEYSCTHSNFRAEKRNPVNESSKANRMHSHFGLQYNLGKESSEYSCTYCNFYFSLRASYSRQVIFLI